jgi:hypothetical protein
MNDEISETFGHVCKFVALVNKRHVGIVAEFLGQYDNEQLPHVVNHQTNFQLKWLDETLAIDKEGFPRAFLQLV